MAVTLLCFTSCEEGTVLGCTDQAAANYNSSATENDGSCLYSIVKTWWFSSFIIDGVESYTPGDYWTFNDDGSYLSYIDGVGTEVGTYSGSGNTITITSLTLNGEAFYNTGTFNVELNSTTLIISGTIGGVSVTATLSA